MAAKTGSRVEIGFLEKSESWKLDSRFFPSKVGGKPAWLDLKSIDIDLKCGHCSKTCVFLCQLYAPLSDIENAYHRTIFIFICKDPECSQINDNRNLIVYRCQLGRINEFYSVDEPEDRIDWCSDVNIRKYTPTCLVCGCFGPNQCGNCKIAQYCSREHQVMDWKSGHNKKCSSAATIESSVKILFPEYEIISESEILEDEDMLEKTEERSEEERINDYQKLAQKLKGGSLCNVDPKVMEEFAMCEEDKFFKRFKKRLNLCPDQVIRYDRGGEPLWISEPDCNIKIPDCEECSGPREFEFQVLPTVLSFLDVDSLEKSIDWGTLIIYTCSRSCNSVSPYVKEYLLKQDTT